MKWAGPAYLVLVLWMTVSAFAQPLSTIDTVQNLEISRAQDAINESQRRIDTLASAVSSLSGSIDRGTGIVIGIGSTLTLLQIIQMFMSRDRKREGR